MPATLAPLILTAPLWIVAQAPSARAQQPTFRASTQLVEVDVNVTDHTGAFVPDLSVDDFALFDQGKRRPIEIAYVVHSGKVTVAAHGAAKNGDASPLAPSARRTLIFYFDVTHMTYGQLRRAGTGAQHFLSTEFDEGDIAGILVGDRMINNHLTTNRAELLAGIRAASGATQTKSGAAPTSTGSGTTGQAGAAPTGSEADQEIAERLDDADKVIVSGPTGSAELSTLQTLERLVDALARVPGRKNVVYFSAGFFVTGAMPGGNRKDELLALLRRISEKAAHSDVHIYSIDVTGLDKGIGSSAILTATEPAFANASAANGAHLRTDPGPEDLLTQLAADTGGLLFLNQNYYDETLRKIDDDTGSYYVLAFRPDRGDKKVRTGAFRTVKVTIDRSDLTVRARKGYIVE